jgi:hypothetical protein
MNFIGKILLNSLYGRFGMSDNLGYFELFTDEELTDIIKSKLEVEDIISLGCEAANYLYFLIK